MTEPNPNPPAPGYLQTLSHSPPSTITIHDTIYGSTTITEPLLLDLLQSPALLRLSTVHQHGITGLLSLTPKITRLEHSIGAFLIVRSVGASLSEQVAALLHDISHTSLSHVVDWALSKPGEDSFHEVHKMRYVNSTDLPSVIARYAADLSSDGNLTNVFNEELYPLVETPAPHLCADRIDYALRDAVAFGKLSTEEAKQIFASLRAYPDAQSPERMLVMQSQDERLALKFARAYLAMDRDVWSNPANIDMYKRAGFVIGDAVRSGSLDEGELWRLSDEDFWEVLRGATDDFGRGVMRRLEVEGLPGQGEVKGLPVGTKVRTLDPDVLCVGGEGVRAYQPLSVFSPAWAAEREEYIRARRGLIEIEQGA